MIAFIEVYTYVIVLYVLQSMHITESSQSQARLRTPEGILIVNLQRESFQHFAFIRNLYERIWLAESTIMLFSPDGNGIMG